ncbi:MAG: methyltransferase domain-containing protein [Gammaproteobacteria bacterium]|nr:methyltransferase domain-containing protein [Gammaproteobacteria bacterium]
MIAEYYDHVWTRKLSLPAYGDLRSRWRSRWQFAFDAIGENARVLDAACGDGVFGDMLIQRKRCQVIGLDISAYARARAQERGLQTYACDISSQPFPVADASVDCVTMLCCLEHVFDPGHALREAARVIKPGARVLVTLPNAVQIAFRLAFLTGRLSSDLLHTNDGEGLHIRFFDYAHDFERLVATQVPQLRVIDKTAALKNPRAYGSVRRRLLAAGLRVWPNLFAEYAHYTLAHTDPAPQPPAPVTRPA